MDREALAQRLMATFLDELEERVGELNRDLLALEKADPAAQQELVQSLFRTAHSLKGASRSVGLRPIENVSHALEDLLARTRDGARVLGAEEYRELFLVADAYDDAGKRLRSGRPLNEGLLPVALASLTQMRRGGRDGRRAPARTEESPASAPVAHAAPAKPVAADVPPTVARDLGKEASALHEGARGPRELEGAAGAASIGPVSAAGSSTEPRRTETPASAPPGSAAPLSPGATNEAERRGSEGPPPMLPGRPVASGTRDASLRVRSERLDALLARAGELRVACGRLESEREAMQGLCERTAQLRAEVQPIVALAARETGHAKNGGASGANGRRPDARVETRGSTWAGSGASGGAQASGVERYVPSPASVARLTRMRHVIDTAQKVEAEASLLAGAFERDLRNVVQLAQQLDEDVRRLRMVPFAEACGSLERTVRDLMTAEGKDVELVVEGGEVMLDRYIVQRLADPLLHLVRNAVNHGLEREEARRAAGKPVRGRLVVSATHRGSVVDVKVSDDGRGLDLAAIRAKASERGIPIPADERDVARLVFQAGFSTAPSITEVSGRGVGLDVVSDTVIALHGSVGVDFVAGAGTTLTLVLPVTLTTLRAVVVRAERQRVVMAAVGIKRMLRVRPDEVLRAEGGERIAFGSRTIPLASLAAILGIAAAAQTTSNGGRAADAFLTVIVMEAEGREAAFAVDEPEAERLVMVKSLGERLRRVRYVAGATILDSGEVALILNATDLVRAAHRVSPREGVVRARPDRVEARPRRLLVADDSVTTRMLEKMILESAGYEVTVAADGADAWRSIQESPPDLVVSDVEMPRMDGVALCTTIRASPRFRSLPVVLVTGLASDADRRRGLESGADAYVVKSAFDQKMLLETIARLL